MSRAVPDRDAPDGSRGSGSASGVLPAPWGAIPFGLAWSSGGLGPNTGPLGSGHGLCCATDRGGHGSSAGLPGPGEPLAGSLRGLRSVGIESATPGHRARIGYAPAGAAALGAGAGALVGILTDGDIRRGFLAKATFGMIDEAMTAGPLVTGPDELAHSALALMNEKSITQLFVIEAGALVGILHIHDMLRAGVA